MLTDAEISECYPSLPVSIARRVNSGELDTSDDLVQAYKYDYTKRCQLCRSGSPLNRILVRLRDLWTEAADRTAWESTGLCYECQVVSSD